MSWIAIRRLGSATSTLLTRSLHSLLIWREDGHSYSAAEHMHQNQDQPLAGSITVQTLLAQ